VPDSYLTEPVDRLPFGSDDKARRYRTDLYRGAVGRNWYECDPTLQFLMRRHLGADGLAWATPHLTALGALMGGPIAERAEETDRNPPRLERYDRWGHEVSRVVMPETFEASRRDLVATAFGSPAFREQARSAGVDPAPLNAAWSYLLDQAEIGMACALGTGGDMVMRLADQFAPDDVKARVAERFAAGENSGEAAQMLTERTGGSDLAALETTATPDGDAWRLNGFKWFASNANGSVFVVLAKPEGADDGIRGIAPFLVLWERRDGGRNGIKIRRLKDKLGTKAVASAEIEFVDAEAFMLAPSGADGSSSGAAGDGRGLARMM
jgi:alkylation response protein AidB-like acyl-CoA dehydrogenase